MRNWVGTVTIGKAVSALALGMAAGGMAFAQDAATPTAAEDESFDEAFPQMISQEVVQGDIAPPAAEEQPWSLDAVQALITYIEGISAEGLDPADYDLRALQVSLQSGPSVELDQLASKNFKWLVEDLRDGRTPMEARKQWFVVDPDRDKYRTGDLLAEATQTGDVKGVLDGLHPIHADYAALRAELAATPEEDVAKRKLIRANMDRWRWLARDLGTIHLITNVPEYQLRLRAGAKTFTYRTIVGKPGRTATPQLAENVSGVVFNPTWTVPQSIVKGEGLGQRVLNNPAWAKAKGYKATKGANGWITVVQQPGPTNSLGRMKLEMPNRHAIFFHDTPSRGLFNNTSRALSHGCIRTEKALQLAMTVAILGKAASKDEVVKIATSGKYTKVQIEKEIPAYITYFTMGTNTDGELTTFKDIYDRDAPVLASLDKPRQENRATVSDDEVIVIENNPLAGG
ncbi:MAG: L,D-transpeptidase family protein [Pseudomonadota bacterium]|nr:L,D-transpeptidase family protein [Pseudomonadota bacterium]